MKNIATLLEKRQITIKSHLRPINPTWEEAAEFGGYLGLKTIFVMRLFKLYGKAKVLSLRSYFKDLPKSSLTPKLIVWKIKNSN